MKRDYISLILRIAVIVLIGWLLFTQVFLVTQMNGNPMFPSIKDGDLIIGFRLQKNYVKNDVAAYNVNGKLHIGRVVAREGDVVTLDDTGALLVNGTVQSGEIMYPTHAKEGIEYPFRVPEQTVFLLGDYRTNTEDSRDFGAIPIEDMIGKVITILRRRGI